MTDAAWDPAQLDRLEATEELRIAPARRDGTLRLATPVWVERVGDEVQIPFLARNGRQYTSYVPTTVAPQARATTLTLVPAKTR